MFLDTDGGRLAGGSHDANTVSALVNVPVDELAQCVIVHRVICQHGRNEGDDASPNRVM